MNENIKELIEGLSDEKKRKTSKVLISITKRRKKAIMDKFKSIENFENVVAEVYEGVFGKRKV